MRIGIGLPAAIPAAPAPSVGAWAQAAEQSGFQSVSVIDRLVYDNLDPIVALAAAAAVTERVELLTTVLNVPYRTNGLVLAKQLASLDAIAGGRLTAGLGIGGWPEDHEAVGPAREGLGAAMDHMLATMQDTWRGTLSGASGPMPAMPRGRPQLLFGGFVPAAFARAARFGTGWVAPSFGHDQLVAGVAGVRAAWKDAGRDDRPRVVVERYFCLGADATSHARRYISHYYGTDYADQVMADTVTNPDLLDQQLQRLGDAGCDDVIFLPCTPDRDQVGQLAHALRAVGAALPAEKAA